MKLTSWMDFMSILDLTKCDQHYQYWLTLINNQYDDIGLFWVHFGSILGPFWVQYWDFLGYNWCLIECICFISYYLTRRTLVHTYCNFLLVYFYNKRFWWTLKSRNSTTKSNFLMKTVSNNSSFPIEQHRIKTSFWN